MKPVSKNRPTDVPVILTRCCLKSVVTTLRRDLKSHNNDHWPTRLHSINDLDHLRDIAQNRSDWKHLTTAIYRSAQAETSVDVAADGH
ncbi:hypothetical protein ElyMa_003919000 [Elysia marginata]|uniref:Uncharacterized protein n=1 Tax=Elysia marginata TaxID=1093978 RepID=A0AAV4FQZ3_9GAST|nr:hypothetical protein ElyMa_003919000 [Elysia marginata]